MNYRKIKMSDDPSVTTESIYKFDCDHMSSDFPCTNAAVALLDAAKKKKKSVVENDCGKDCGYK